MADAAPYDVEDDFDLQTIYNSSKQALETYDLKQALNLVEKGLQRAKKNSQKKWIKDFDVLHSKVKTELLEKEIQKCLKRAKEEQDIFQDEKVLKFYKEARKHYHTLYKMGKTEVNKEIKKLSSKIGQIEEKLKKEQRLKQLTEEISQDTEDLDKKEDLNDSLFYDYLPSYSTHDNNTKSTNGNNIGHPPQEMEEFSGDIEESETPSPPIRKGPPKRLSQKIPRNQKPSIKEELKQKTRDKNGETLSEPPKPMKSIKGKAKPKLEKPKIPPKPKNKIKEKIKEKPPNKNQLEESLGDLKEKAHIKSVIANFMDDEEEAPHEEGKLSTIVQQSEQQSMIQKRQQVLAKEIFPPTTIQQLTEISTSSFRDRGYLIVPSEKLSKTFKNIDFLALHVMELNEDTDAILIFPVRICDLKGTLIVSEQKTTYRSYKPKQKLDRVHEKLLIQKNLGSLSEIPAQIKKSILSKGRMFTLLEKFMNLDIEIKYTAKKEALFFYNGPIEYKIFIEPLLVTKEQIGFLEKEVPFPYRKKDNLHFVPHEVLTEYIEYIETKDNLIEQETQGISELKQYFNCVKKFANQTYLLSCPFLVYAFVFLILLIMRVDIFFITFWNIGLAFLFLYIAVFSYMYYRFILEKKEIKREFNTPHYKKKLDLSEAELMILSEELGSYLEQFVYEVIGKKMAVRKSRLSLGSVNKMNTQKDPNYYIED